MARWWVAGLTLALALACGGTAEEPVLPPPYVPPDEDPSAGKRPRDGRKAAPDSPRRGKGGKGPSAEDPTGEEPPDEGTPGTPSPGGGDAPATVTPLCADACEHVVACELATFDECTAQCHRASRDQLEMSLDMTCKQLRSVLEQLR